MALTKVTYSMIDGAPINVRDYGATGDGVTDDTTALRAAFTAGAGKSVYLPAGTYIINRATTDTARWLPISSNTEYFGDGFNTIIKIKDGYNQGGGTITAVTPFFVATVAGSVTNVEIHDLCIDGNRANITHPAESPSLIYVIQGSSNVNIYNCWLKNPGGDCVTIGSAGAPNLGGERVFIHNNIAENPGRSCFVMTSARDVVISDNLGIDAQNSYVDIETDLVTEFVGNVTITGNVFKAQIGNLGTGFACTGPGTHFNIVCANNVFTSVTNVASLGGSANESIKFVNNTCAGLYATGNQYLIEVIGGLKNGEISGNTINIQGSSSGGIWVRGPYQVNVSNNTIRGSNFSTGINVDDPYGLANPAIKITGNSVYGITAGKGIAVTGNINTVISDNYVDVQASTSNAIEVTSSTAAVVSGNTCLSSGTTAQGIICSASPKVLVQNNRTTGFDSGIRLVDSPNSNVSNNVASGAGGYGLLLNTSDYPTVVGNMLIGNTTGAFSSSAVTGYFPNLSGVILTDLPKFNRFT